MNEMTRSKGKATGFILCMLLIASGALALQSFLPSKENPPQTALPAPLTASFVHAGNPLVNQSITFIANSSGGVKPYSYSWRFGDGTNGTGLSISHTYIIAGSFNISLTITDAAAQTAVSTTTLSIGIRACPTGCSETAPVLTGWGGIRLDEAGNDMESHIQLFQSLGYNAIRVSFESPCSSPHQEGPYSPTNMGLALSLAKKNNFWIIIDMHGYLDIYPTNQPCWLSNWKQVIQQFSSSYSRIIWQPENEPQSNYYGNTQGVSLTQLSAGYQAWIDQARSLGDTHWITVANGCISTCESTPSIASSMWPAVNDTLGRVFIDWHFYMYYPYWSTQGTGWNNATAELAATSYYNLLVAGTSLTGWPAINTEGGADYIGGCPADIILGPCNPSSGIGQGTCDGYTRTTVHFVQKLVSLYNSSNPRIDWIGWPAGSWSTNLCNPPSSSISYGALQPASPTFSGGWATNLTLPGLSVSFATNPANLVVNSRIAFTATSSGGSPSYVYTWNLGDGTQDAGENITHVYSTNGPYLVGLTVKDAANKTATFWQMETVRPPPDFTISATPSPLSITVGSTGFVTVTLTGINEFSGSINLTATSSSQSLTSSISPETVSLPLDGQERTLLTISAANNASSENYTLAVTSSDLELFHSLLVPVRITSTPLPLLQGSISWSPTAPLIGQVVNLMASASNGLQPYSFTWFLGDGSTNSGTTVSHTYEASGNYTVTVMIADSSNDTQSTHATLTISSIIMSPVQLSVPDSEAGSLGSILSFRIDASNPVDQGSITLFATNLPLGASFTSSSGNPAIGEFSWNLVPSVQPGSYNVTFTAYQAGATSSMSKKVPIRVSSERQSCLPCQLTLSVWPVASLLGIGAMIGVAITAVGILMVNDSKGRRQIHGILNTSIFRYVFGRHLGPRTYERVRTLGTIKKMNRAKIIERRKHRSLSRKTRKKHPRHR